MTREAYSQYYIQGSDHYLIPKDNFEELFNEMVYWKEDVQKYKEVIDKLNKLISDNSEKYWVDDNGEPKYLFNEVRDILKEVI